ncbi:hypothetical protein Aduo_006215 [Ancylostoma duodenale]
MLPYGVGDSLYRSRVIKYDVITLQETKGRKETVRKTDHNELLVIGARVENRDIGGVGFLINSTVQHLVDSLESTSPPLAILRLRTKGQGVISIINGYAPTSAATDGERKDFYQLLEKTVREKKSYAKFVVGDFNAIVGTNCNDDWRLGPYGSTTRSENGRRLLRNFTFACRLLRGNSTFEKPADRRWTGKVRMG